MNSNFIMYFYISKLSRNFLSNLVVIILYISVLYVFVIKSNNLVKNDGKRQWKVAMKKSVVVIFKDSIRYIVYKLVKTIILVS